MYYQTIQMSSLGKAGRFGNQLFQYAFAKSYAKKYNCIFEIPADWIGRNIFEIDDSSLSRQLPKTEIDDIPFGQVNIDLTGYFQHQKFLDIMNPDDVRKWFTFRKEWTDKFKKPKDFYVASHLRHGDYVGGEKYCTITEKCYLDSCEKFGYHKEDVIIVSEEKRQPDDPCDMEFLYDFFVLMNADVIFRSNSTFGWWSGFLGNQKVVYSPVDYQGGLQYCEYRILSPYMESFEVRREFENLYAINLLLWEVEDDIREKEKIEEFDEEFISLARKVYRLNDERARIKKTINEKTGSELVEEKSYKEWE